MEDKAERGDIFTDAWEDETGGIVADSREDEVLPDDGADAAPEEQEEPEEQAGDAAPEVKGPGNPAPSTPEARDRDIAMFIREYPDVTAEAIPPAVWRAVAAGESLLSAYSRHEASVLRRENRRLESAMLAREQSRSNRERSAGSQLGAGAGRAARDPFDDGWELEW